VAGGGSGGAAVYFCMPQQPYLLPGASMRQQLAFPLQLATERCHPQGWPKFCK
jgi:hypothetical protein